jgi:hypothetical protein
LKGNQRQVESRYPAFCTRIIHCPLALDDLWRLVAVRHCRTTNLTGGLQISPTMRKRLSNADAQATKIAKGFDTASNRSRVSSNVQHPTLLHRIQAVMRENLVVWQDLTDTVAWLPSEMRGSPKMRVPGGYLSFRRFAGNIAAKAEPRILLLCQKTGETTDASSLRNPTGTACGDLSEQ